MKAYALDSFKLYFEDVPFPKYKIKKPNIKVVQLSKLKHPKNTTKR